MEKFLKHFDRVTVISLPERNDRRERLLKNLTSCGLAEPDDLTWLDAVDGRQAELPSWWKAGSGAWGCRFSQLAAIESAQRDGLKNLLILEDDAYFHRRAGEWLDDIMAILPADWGQLFLGGQHMRPPKPSDHPKIFEGTCITRTHAYAINRPLFQTLIDLIKDDQDYKDNPGRHVDHQFGEQQSLGTWKAYAPAWWLAGQDEGLSDIANCAPYPRRWWQEGRHYWKLPFVRVSQQDSEETKLHLYQAEKPPPTQEAEAILWLRDVAREAWNRGLLPSCPSSLNLPKDTWPGGFVEANAAPSKIRTLADFPANGLFPHSFSKT